MGAAASNVAQAQQIRLETIDHAEERTAFGQPLGSIQHNKFLIAQLVTKIEVAQAYVDDCVEAHAERRPSAVDAARRGSGQAR